jgi:hypothetical protein
MCERTAEKAKEAEEEMEEAEEAEKEKGEEVEEAEVEEVGSSFFFATIIFSTCIFVCQQQHRR